MPIHTLPLHHNDEQSYESHALRAAPQPTLPCTMAGVRWPSPPLLINTRGGHHRKEEGGISWELKNRGIFLERREKSKQREKKKKETGEKTKEGRVFLVVENKDEQGTRIWEKQRREGRLKRNRNKKNEKRKTETERRTTKEKYTEKKKKDWQPAKQFSG